MVYVHISTHTHSSTRQNVKGLSSSFHEWRPPNCGCQTAQPSISPSASPATLWCMVAHEPSTDQCEMQALWSLHRQRYGLRPVSYTHLRAHETDSYLVCRLLL